MKNANHIQELDGIRGVAILMVVVYHSIGYGVRPPEGWFTRLANYGFSGVDLFFVLSGFLITGILLNAKGKPGYFRDFYAKRALRIWPLYYVLVLATFGLGPMLIRAAHLPLADLASLKGGHKIIYVLLLQNFWYYRATVFLAVTWSLAIEEQFYIVWPWMVLFLSRKNLARVLAFMLFFSLGVRIWAVAHGISSESIYFQTCYRLDGLSFGALIALWSQSDLFSLDRAKWAGVAALALGVPTFAWCYERRSWPLLYSMVALASAGAVTLAIWCCKTNSVFGRPLRATWLRYIGKVSYCFYLVHLPVYYVLDAWLARRYAATGWRVFVFSLVFGLIVSLAIASLSWYLFESQILKLKAVLEYRRTFPPVDLKPGPVWIEAPQVQLR